MKVTSIRVRLVQQGRLEATASVVLNDAIVIHDLKLIKAGERLFVAMPSKINKITGEHMDIVHPINAEARATLEGAVIDAYKNL